MSKRIRWNTGNTDDDPKIEDFQIRMDTQVGGGDVEYKTGGVKVGAHEILELLLLKKILVLLEEINVKL